MQGAARMTTGDVIRSNEANKKMWAMLRDISRQVDWPVDGLIQKVDEESWKHIFSAGLRKHQRVAAGIEGGFVILGQHTSQFSRREMADLITIMFAFGDERSVRWSDPKIESLQQWADLHCTRRAA
jgi:hypothetical protein